MSWLVETFKRNVSGQRALSPEEQRKQYIDEVERLRDELYTARARLVAKADGHRALAKAFVTQARERNSIAFQEEARRELKQEKDVRSEVAEIDGQLKLYDATLRTVRRQESTHVLQTTVLGKFKELQRTGAVTLDRDALADNVDAVNEAVQEAEGLVRDLDRANFGKTVDQTELDQDLAGLERELFQPSPALAAAGSVSAQSQAPGQAVPKAAMSDQQLIAALRVQANMERM